MTPVSYRLATVPKRGLSATQNEDAAAARPTPPLPTHGPYRFAVADGASEGWQSGPWADELAVAYCRQPPFPADYADWLAAARASFAERFPAPTTTSWYAEEKQQHGAFATLTGLSVEEARGGGWRWRATAVGDSCLFQVRSGNLVTRFPVETSAAFGNRPVLIGSRTGGDDPSWFAGKIEPGDVFYLLTDAAAEWFLKVAEGGGRPWDELDAADFATWVTTARSAGRLKNDDTTMIRIAIGTAP